MVPPKRSRFWNWIRSFRLKRKPSFRGIDPESQKITIRNRRAEEILEKPIWPLPLRPEAMELRRRIWNGIETNTPPRMVMSWLIQFYKEMRETLKLKIRERKEILQSTERGEVDGPGIFGVGVEGEYTAETKDDGSVEIKIKTRDNDAKDNVMDVTLTIDPEGNALSLTVSATAGDAMPFAFFPTLETD
ncbi:MAG: hypothetical protein V1776_01495 [Candidatus Diapherotrites archaeon]